MNDILYAINQKYQKRCTTIILVALVVIYALWFTISDVEPFYAAIFAILGFVVPIIFSWTQSREKELSEWEANDKKLTAVSSEIFFIFKMVNTSAAVVFQRHMCNLKGVNYDLFPPVTENSGPTHFKVEATIMSRPVYESVKKDLSLLPLDILDCFTLNENRFAKAYSEYGSTDPSKVSLDVYLNIASNVVAAGVCYYAQLIEYINGSKYTSDDAFRDALLKTRIDMENHFNHQMEQRPQKT